MMLRFSRLQTFSTVFVWTSPRAHSSMEWLTVSWIVLSSSMPW